MCNIYQHWLREAFLHICMHLLPLFHSLSHFCLSCATCSLGLCKIPLYLHLCSWCPLHLSLYISYFLYFLFVFCEYLRVFKGKCAVWGWQPHSNVQVHWNCRESYWSWTIYVFRAHTVISWPQEYICLYKSYVSLNQSHVTEHFSRAFSPSWKRIANCKSDRDRRIQISRSLCSCQKEQVKPSQPIASSKWVLCSSLKPLEKKK